MIIDFSMRQQQMNCLTIVLKNRCRSYFVLRIFGRTAEKVEESAKKVAVLKSANMSLGINLLMKILKDATKVLSPAGYDIELVEKHHNQKLDAPSGTALALADSINEAADNQYHYVYDRSQVRQKRDQKEIGHFGSTWWNNRRRPRSDLCRSG